MYKNKVYPRSSDNQTVYLKSVVTRPTIEVGDFTIYNDFVNDPRNFEKNNVLYHYPINNDRLIISLRCEVYFQLRQSYAEITIDLHIPFIFRGMGLAKVGSCLGLG